jgi:hypothetical protein
VPLIILHLAQSLSPPTVMLAFLLLTIYAAGTWATYYIDDRSPLIYYTPPSAWNTSSWSQAYYGTL